MEISTYKIDSFDEIFDSQYFQLMKRLLKIIGLWPYETGRKKILYRYCFLFTMCLIIVPMVNGIKTYYGKDRNIFLECLMETIFVAEFILIHSFCLWIESRGKIRKIFDTIAQFWILTRTDGERRILVDFAKQGHTKSRILGGFAILTTVIFTAVPPIVELAISLVKNRTGERIMTIKGDYFVDQHVYYYQINIILTAVAVLNAVTIYSLITLFLMVWDQNIAFFKLVRYQIIEAIKFNDDNETYRQLVQAARIHQRALQFAALFENTNSMVCLWILGATVIFLSFNAVCILNTDNINEILKCLTVEIIGFIQLYILSWPGQQFINHSTDIYSCVYDCDWYLSSKRNKKLFQIMMLRSQKPTTLTAGGLYVLSYENGLAVFKTALSYMAVMRSMRED